MKSVRMHRAHDVHTSRHSMRHYRGGKTYHQVLEAHADAIVAAGAGEIIDAAQDEGEGGDAKVETRPNPRKRRK